MTPGGRRLLFSHPYAVFCTIFSFLLPPIGFLMAFHGYRKDKEIGDSYVGWVVLMIISSLATIVLIIILIFSLNQPKENTSFFFIPSHN